MSGLFVIAVDTRLEQTAKRISLGFTGLVQFVDDRRRSLDTPTHGFEDLFRVSGGMLEICGHERVLHEVAEHVVVLEEPLTDTDTRFLLALRETRSKAKTKHGQPVKPATPSSVPHSRIDLTRLPGTCQLCESSTSRTFRVSSTPVNGLPRKGIPSSNTPCRTTTSSV